MIFEQKPFEPKVPSLHKSEPLKSELKDGETKSSQPKMSDQTTKDSKELKDKKNGMQSEMARQKEEFRAQRRQKIERMVKARQEEEEKKRFELMKEQMQMRLLQQSHDKIKQQQKENDQLFNEEPQKLQWRWQALADSMKQGGVKGPLPKLSELEQSDR